MDPNGNGPQGYGNGQFMEPWGIAVNDEGYAAVFSPEGEVEATFGQYGVEAGAFSLPTGIEVDDDGYVYVTDTNGQRVVRFEPVP